VPSIEATLNEMISKKEDAGRADSYTRPLKLAVKAFMEGRESLGVDKFTVDDAEKFLKRYGKSNYRITLRRRLCTLFSYAVRKHYRKDNPFDKNHLERIAHRYTPPSVMTVGEVTKLLEWLSIRSHARVFAWFVLSTFAGMRPEEAEKTTWEEIDFEHGWVKIEAQTTKVRQRRVITPRPMFWQWLKLAQQLDSELPLTPAVRLGLVKDLKEVVGWKEWKADVTRHSFASYSVAESHNPDLNALVKFMGNSVEELDSKYKALVTPTEAKKFWDLLPAEDALAKADAADAKEKKKPRVDLSHLTREKLYDLTGSMSLVKLGKKLGVSDVTLHKLCRKLNVPTPPVGYWSKLARGRAPARPLLPPITSQTAEDKAAESPQT
jgi:integrase